MHGMLPLAAAGLLSAAPAAGDARVAVLVEAAVGWSCELRIAAPAPEVAGRLRGSARFALRCDRMAKASVRPESAPPVSSTASMSDDTQHGVLRLVLPASLPVAVVLF